VIVCGKSMLGKIKFDLKQIREGVLELFLLCAKDLNLSGKCKRECGETWSESLVEALTYIISASYDFIMAF
jgi:hypothetical protein